jgi:hypothetical protein
MSAREPEFAIADTCFLIDWARYRHRDVLFKLFKTVFVPETILREVKSENTIAWIASNLAKGRLTLYTETADVVSEATSIVEASKRSPHLISVELPEAVCLAVGRRRGYVVLTENRGLILFSSISSDYRDVAIWRALEVIAMASLKELLEIECSDLEVRFKEYEEEAKHLFPRRDLSRVVEVLRVELCRSR